MGSSGVGFAIAKGKATGSIGLQVLVLVAAAALWELVARTGILFADVVPPLARIGRAMLATLGSSAFYSNLGVTFYELSLSVVIGSLAGFLAGILLGINRWLSSVYEPFVYYLGATPKILFFPVAFMWFGVGPESKIAIGALSCFFPVALNTAAAARQIRPIYINVGRSFRLTTQQMVLNIYLPAIRTSVINGIRLGIGVAFLSILLCETKLSNQGLGYLVIHSYFRFDVSELYALLLLVFIIAAMLNWAISSLRDVAQRSA